MDANMLMLYVMIITHVQKIPVTMQLDVFTLILALNVKLKTNVMVVKSLVMMDACTVDACDPDSGCSQ
jgi:hypothetical protein